MAENVDNLVLEQLRLLREDLADMKSRMEERFSDLEVGQQSLQGVVMGLGHYMHVLDHRVENLEHKIGGDQ